MEMEGRVGKGLLSLGYTNYFYGLLSVAQVEEMLHEAGRMN